MENRLIRKSNCSVGETLKLLMNNNSPATREIYSGTLWDTVWWETVITLQQGRRIQNDEGDTVSDEEYLMSYYLSKRETFRMMRKRNNLHYGRHCIWWGAVITDCILGDIQRLTNNNFLYTRTDSDELENEITSKEIKYRRHSLLPQGNVAVQEH